MNLVEKIVVVSAGVSVVLLILTNPTGTSAAGSASSGLLTAWFKGLQGKS